MVAYIKAVAGQPPLDASFHLELGSRVRWVEYSRSEGELFRYTDVKHAGRGTSSTPTTSAG